MIWFYDSDTKEAFFFAVVPLTKMVCFCVHQSILIRKAEALANCMWNESEPTSIDHSWWQEQNSITHSCFQEETELWTFIQERMPLKIWIYLFLDYTLHMGEDNFRHKYRLGRVWIESSPEEKGLGCWLPRSSTWACSPEGQQYPGLHQVKHGLQVERDDSAPLLHSGETLPGLLCSVLEPSAQERHGCVGEGPEGGDKNSQMDGMPLLWGKA